MLTYTVSRAWHAELCDYGQRQTMGHIVDSCPLTQRDGSLMRLHEADVDAVVDAQKPG